MLAFRSLDPFRALREPDRRRRDEERLSRSEQRTGKNQKRLLDRKSPIQVRIHLPPAVSQQPFGCSGDWAPGGIPVGNQSAVLTGQFASLSPKPRATSVLSSLPRRTNSVRVLTN